jgi:hypothetical protein
MEKTEKITKNIQELYQSGKIGKHDRYGSGDKIVNKLFFPFKKLLHSISDLL